MSGDKAQGAKVDAAALTESIVNETLFSVVHDLVLQIHCREKKLLQTLHPTTRLPICPSCNLPRLLDPPLAQSNPGKSTQYCTHIPWSTRPYFDIYGNPFPVAGNDKPPTKKERERLKAESNAAKSGKSQDGTPASQEQNGTAPPSPSANDNQPNTGGPVDKKAAKVGERLKGGTYVPWHTCPSCKRSLLITRFAQHLEKCLGIGGRGAARNVARANANSSVGSPAGSRGATPVGSGRNRSDDEDDDNKAGNVRKKVLKRGLKENLKKGDRPSKGSNGKSANGISKKPPKIDTKSDKRERDDQDDDDDDGTPLRKRMKLQRMGSTVSLQASIAGEGSIDGSFVDGDDSGDD
ncbi:hypothetical protein AAFC00_007143 [Neodothiora populina]|uniref:SAGA-associated factor 11 n=1 Tax=Neodothiora populina TaxID=2781224 RepID=A0ABR3PHB2_9PEZI